MAKKRHLPGQLIVGVILISFFVLVGLISLLWLPEEAGALNVSERLSPTGTEGHLLGTDKLGRDVLAQIMAGAQTSLLVAVLSTAGAVLPGVALGLLAAGAGTFARDVISRATDVAIALPGILIALVLATALGPSNTTTIIAIAVWFIPTMARITLGPARQILAREFIEAAMAYGRSRPFVLVRHVLPNISPLIIVQASLMFAAAVLIESALSYLGIGAQRPTPSWGRLLNESQSVIDQAPMLVVYPGLAIVLTVLGFNLIGDGLRTLLDPRQDAKVVV